MNYKNKSFMTKKRAFTLIELLIVIAIIGILFIVLVSKVDFATDKAKATGVQTDFRSFQLAFDTVAKENAGFNTFGWDTGDANQNGKRDSYDEGDNGAGGGTAKNGIQDGTEIFTGHKVYAETFTKVFSLKKNGTGAYDRDALNRLETAINANLDPKLHITIKDDGEIVMANGAQDPWNKEYHGYYITNAENDGKDRGAIVMYSDGANNEFGSEHSISNGVVKVIVPGNNKNGKDDYSIVSCYTYANGYGEVKNATTGFSNNQTFLTGNGTVDGSNNNGTEIMRPGFYQLIIGNNQEVELGESNNVIFSSSANYGQFVSFKIDNETVVTDNYFVSSGSTVVEVMRSYIDTLAVGEHTVEIVSNDGSAIGKFIIKEKDITNLIPGVYDQNNNLLVNWETLVKSVDDGGYGLDPSRNYTWSETSSHANHINAIMSSISNIYRIVIPGDVILGEYSFANTSLKSIIVKDGLVETPSGVFSENRSLIEIVLPNSITKLGYRTLGYCTSLTYFDFPDNLTEVGDQVCCGCSSLKEVSWPTNIQTINSYAFSRAGFTTLELPDTVVNIGESAFSVCQNLVYAKLPKNLETIPKSMFSSSNNLRNVVWPENIKVIESMAFFGTDFTSLVIPETVERIDSAAFSQNYRMVEVINKSSLPSTSSALQFQTWDWGVSIVEDESQSKVFKQGDWVFWNNPNGQLYLIAYQGNDESVTLPNYNNTPYVLNEHVFVFNKTIKHITFSEYAISVTGHFCYDTPNLESITIPCNIIVNSIFPYPRKLYNTNKLTNIYVPESLVDSYKSANFWSLYENIIKPIG